MVNKIKHKGLRKFYKTGSLKGIVPEHALRLRVILARLDASKEAQDMNLPGLALHSLQGFWAVSGNWRVTFQFEDNAATNINYINYH